LVEVQSSNILVSSDRKPFNLVLVLVESWGDTLDPGLQNSLIQPYLGADLSAKYSVTSGSVPFHGPTLAGEGRELCGNTLGFGLLSASVAQLKDCLPTKLGARGYHSTSVHGFSAGMFRRHEWYGRMGFDEMWFRDELEREGLPLCRGPFPGICDAAIADWVGKRLQRNSDSPQFIYWVTLNSHLPVPLSNLVKDAPSCAGLPAAEKSRPICSWYQLIFNVHRSVAEVAMRSTARPTIFVIVGDHAPPFPSGDLRKQFSQEVVPYVVLVPKIQGIKEKTMRPLLALSDTSARKRRQGRANTLIGHDIGVSAESSSRKSQKMLSFLPLRNVNPPL
jgi:phosphoglycerol transferase MdoB-like AlkP superfamily enzyme